MSDPSKVLNERFSVRNELLKKIISFYWYLEHKKDQPETIVSPKLYANCNPTIIINFGDPILYDSLNTSYQFTTNHIRFANTGYIIIQNAGNIKLMGIHFKPYGLYALLKHDISRYTNSLAPLKNFIPELDFLLNQNKNIDPGPLIGITESYLLNNFPINEIYSEIEDIISVVEKIDKHDFSIPSELNEFITDIDKSKRTIERRFKNVIGVSIDKYLKIKRISRIIYFLAKSNSDSDIWEIILGKFGYFDQAHFIKDFKKYFGYSPAKYKKIKDLLSDVYGATR